MQLETQATTATVSMIQVLRRLEQNYLPDGSISISAYYCDRTTLPDGRVIDGDLIPREAIYPSPAALIDSAIGTSGLPREQVEGLLSGYTALIWGMKAAIENRGPIVGIEN
jgi:hypothetical protein